MVYMESMIYPLGKKQLEAPYKELFVYIAHVSLTVVDCGRQIVVVYLELF